MKIKLWNHLGEENSSIHLSVRELYLYYYLSSLKRLDNVSVTNIDMLQDYLPLSFVKTKKDNKNIMREVLDGLLDKQLISIIHDNNNILKINQVSNKCLLYVKINGDFVNGKFNDCLGYQSIDINTVNSFEKMEYLYIYYVIAKYKNNTIISYSRWSTKLGISETKVKSLIKEMKDKDIIYCATGNYTDKTNKQGQKLQDTNQYSLTPFSDKNKGSVQHNQEADTNTPNESINVSEEVSEGNNDMSGWGESPTKDILSDIDKAIKSFKTYDNHFPEVEDYKQYLFVKDNPLTKKEKELVKIAEKRMKQMKKYYVDKGLDQARQSIIDEQQEIEREEREQYEDKLINDINNGQLVVKRDDKDVYLDGVDALLVTDSIYKCHYMPDSFGGGEYSLDNINVEEIVKEEDDGFGNYHVYSDGVLDQLLIKFKELYAESKDFDVYAIKQKMKRYRDELVEAINNNKEIDEFHEGDLFSGDDDRNISLAMRIAEIKKAN